MRYCTRDWRLEFLKTSRWLHVLLIAAWGLLVYYRGLENFFLEDDAANIGIAQKAVSLFGSRFVTYLSLAFNHVYGGDDPMGYHLFNIVIHIANSVLVYVLIQLLLKTPLFGASPNEQNSLVALLLAMLFLTHPMHNSTVYIISLRSVSLASFFYLSALVLYLGARLKPFGSRRYVFFMLLALSATVASMKSKEISFTIPAVIALSEFIFFYGLTSRRDVIVLFGFTVTFLIIPCGTMDLFDSSGTFHGSANIRGQTTLISGYEYFATQCRVVPGYIKGLLFPLNVHWAPYYRLSRSVFETNVLLSLISLFSLFSLGIYMVIRGNIMKKPEISLMAFGVIWFFVVISVDSSIIPLIELSHDYRAYLPSIGLFITIGGLLMILHERHKRLAPVLVVFLICLVAGSSVISFKRHSVFRNHFSLWGDSLSKDPESPQAAFNFGMQLYSRKRYKEALPVLLRAQYSQDETFRAWLHFSRAETILQSAIRDCSLRAGTAGGLS